MAKIGLNRIIQEATGETAEKLSKIGTTVSRNVDEVTETVARNVDEATEAVTKNADDAYKTLAKNSEAYDLPDNISNGENLGDGAYQEWLDFGDPNVKDIPTPPPVKPEPEYRTREVSYTTKDGREIKGTISEEVKTPEPQIEGQQGYYTDGEKIIISNEADELDINTRRRTAEVNEANKTLGSKVWESAGKVKQGIVETVTGTGESNKKIRGRKTRNIERTEANLNYQNTGEGRAYSKKEYFDEVTSRGATIETDTPKPFYPIGTPEAESAREAARKAAQQAVEETDGIPGWMKVAAVGAATGVVGYTVGRDDGY